MPDSQFDGLKSDSPLEEMFELPIDTAEKTEGGQHCSIFEIEPCMNKNKERFVEIIIEKLFSRILRECKLHVTVGDPKVTLQSLFERTWAKVEGVDFDLLPKYSKNLDKIIFKDLCKKLGDVQSVMLSMRMEEDEELINYIVNSFSRCVTPRTERGPRHHQHLQGALRLCVAYCGGSSPISPTYIQSVANFNLSVGQGITNICRGRTRVGVM